MALIKCPECGKEVSDRAESCPVCGFPLANEKNKGRIKIKLAMYGGIGGTQDVSITSGDNTLWNGKSGQVAEFEVKDQTVIQIKYSTNAMHFGGSCEGIINPEGGNKYAVSIRQGILKTVLTFHAVDVIDSD